MSIDQDIANSARQLETDVRINHQITHGGDTVEVPTEGGPVPSIRKRLKDIETEWSKTADPLASDLASTVQVTKGYKDAAAASASAAAAETVKVTAEGVKQIKAVVDQGTLTIGQVKTEGGKQIAAASSQADRAAAQVPLATEQASRSKNYATESKTASTVATTAKEAAVAAGNTASQHAATASNEATRSEQEANTSATSAGESRTAANRAQEVAAKFGNVDQAIREARQEAERATIASGEAKSSETRATQEADRSKAEADKSAQSRTGADLAKAAAEAARDAATAIVYEGEATLIPAPGKLAVSDEEGKFSHLWLRPIGVPTPDFHMPLSSDIHIREGSGTSTFTRASKATYINPQGVLMEADVGQPRFEREGILIEGSSTNRIEHSTKWNSVSSNSIPKPSPVNNAGLAPDGTNTAWKLDPSCVGNTDRCQRNYSGSVNTANMAFSIFMKSTLPGVRIHFGSATSLSPAARAGIFDFDTRTFVDNGVNCSQTYQEIGNGWIRFRFALSNPDNVMVTETVGFGPPSGTWTLQDTGLLIWGAQLEVLPFSTSYIPTNGEPVTRAADKITLPEEQIFSPQFTLAYDIDVFGANTKYAKTWMGRGTFKNSIKYGDQAQGFIQAKKTGGILFSNHFAQEMKERLKLVCVSDNTQGQFVYKNGLLADSTPAALEAITNLTTFELNPDAQCYFHIRDLKIWHHALTPEQIYNL